MTNLSGCIDWVCFLRCKRLSLIKSHSLHLNNGFVVFGVVVVEGGGGGGDLDEQHGTSSGSVWISSLFICGHVFAA